MKSKEECPSPSCNRSGREEGAVNGKRQSRQSHVTASKQEPSEAGCPELSESCVTGCFRMTKEIDMACLDCACESEPDYKKHEEICTYGMTGGCGHRYRCDRCGAEINISNGERDSFIKKGWDFIEAVRGFAHECPSLASRGRLASEFSGDFCERCMGSLIAWAPVVADILYLKFEVNNLHRSILNVKKDRNNRPTT